MLFKFQLTQLNDSLSDKSQLSSNIVISVLQLIENQLLNSKAINVFWIATWTELLSLLVY